MGERKSGLIRQVISYMRFSSHEFFYDRTRKISVLIQVTVFRGDHMDRFDYLEVTTWAGLTVFRGDHMGRFDCI